MFAFLPALICSFLWSAVTICSKMLAGALPSFAFAFLRFGLAAPFLIPFLMVRKEKETVKVRHLPLLLFLGFSLVLMVNVLFFNALYYSSATSVSLILATNPILTVLVTALLYKHIPNTYQLTAFMLSFAGAVLVITEGKMGIEVWKGGIGEMLMLLGVFFQILYALALRKISVHFSPLFLSFATMISGMLFVLPFVANRECIEILINLSVQQWGIIGFISSLGTAWPLYLYAASIAEMGPAKTSLIVFSSMPVFVSILAYFILGEDISIWQFTGGLFVVSSLVIGLRHTRSL